MKTKLFSLLMALTICSISLMGQFTLLSEDFETNGEGSRYTSNHSGTCNDFFERVGSTPSCFSDPITGVSGSWFFASEDVQDRPGGGDGVITFNNTNVSGYNNLSVSLKMAVSDGSSASWENADNVFVEYAFDGNIGSSYTTVGLFQGNPIGVSSSGFLTVDTDNDPNTFGPYGTQVSSTGVLNTFTFSIPATGNLLSIRIRNTQDGGSEELAFDLVEVKGFLAVNNAPVLANIEGSTISYTEGDPTTQVSNTITVADSENDNITSATVELFIGFEAGADVLSFTPQAGISGSQTGNTLNLSGSATTAQYQAVLRSVTYQNTNVTDPSIANRTVRFRVSDGGNSNFQSRNIDFTQTLNSAVALPACESFETDGHGTRYYAYEYANGNDFWQRHDASGGAHPSHGQAIIGADGNWIWIGEDVSSSNPNPAGIGELLLQPFNAGAGTAFSVEIDVATSDISPSSWETDDYLKVQYKMDGGAWTTIGAFYGDASNNLVADANLDGFADVAGAMLTNTLQRFTYNFNTSGTSLQVRIQHKSNGSEEIAFDRICVDGNVLGNVPPVLANIEAGTFNYVENSGPQQVSNTITVTDAESDIISAASIKVFQGFDASEDALSFTPQFGVNGSFTGNTLTLMGSATTAQYQTLLRSVTYQNTDASDPSLQNRTIQFQVFDGAGSNFQTRDIGIDASLNSAQNLPYCESFETDGHGVRYAAYQFNDASNNFWERHDANGGAHPSHGVAILGSTGNFIWVGEDVKELSNPNPLGVGEMLLNPFNVTTLDSFTVAVNLAVSDVLPLSWETSDYVYVEYKMDAGSWVKIGAFYGDGTTNALTEDADLNGVADPAGTALTNTLATFTYGFAATGNTLQVRLLHSSDGSEELGFDNFCVAGFANCIEPDVPTLSTSGACNPQTLSVTSGNLNGAADWKWYTGSCGGTLVGTGTSIVVSPNSPTTYYVRGEGGCATAGACATIFISPDAIAPSAICQAATIYVDAAGNATLSAADVDGGSTDNCGVDSLYVNKTAFTCADVGTDTVTLTVFDAAGNLSSCDAIVTILDTVPPVVVCQNVTLYLDASGNASGNPFINGALVSRSDNCANVGSITRTGPSTYTCAHLPGLNNIRLRQFDVSGNSTDCFFDVTLLDTIRPTAVCQNITVYLDASGNATISSSDVDGGSSDVCGFGLSLDDSTFTCADIGANTVTLTVTDAGGNTRTCDAIVTVLDTISPVLTCPGNITTSNDAGVCGAKVCFTAPTSVDGCGPQVPSSVNLVAQIGNIRYYKSTGIMTHANAKSLANSFGGELAKITSAALNSTLFNATGGFAWIAGTDEEIEGVWKFDNCEIMTYLNFRAGEPNNGGSGEDFLELSGSGDWLDLGSSDSRFAIIQVEGAGAMQIAGLPRGSVFPIGTTTNTFVAMDSSGNSDTCSFTVTVNDTTSPTSFTDSICPGDSLFVGGAWQTTPGVYTDTATAASGCDSLLVTTLYYQADSICNPDTTVKVLYIVSDSAWTLSNVVSIATSNSYPWPGAANMLPHDSTFVLPAEVGQPYPWTHLYTVMGSEVIKAYSGVTYYRYEFELSQHQALNARFRMFVDDNMQIFINRQEIALEDGMGKMNWRTANHDILFNDNGTVNNGYLGGDPFDTYTAVSHDNIFVTGDNDIILAIRNRTSKVDLGGFSFRMDLDKAGQAVIVKKDATVGSGTQTIPNFDLFPNPVVDQLSLIMDNAKSDVDYTVSITDISGRVLSVISQSGKQLQETSTIDVSSYAAGVYLVKVNSGSQSTVKRFVKR